MRLSITVDAVRPEAMTLTVRVRDTGIGITPEKQDMIFDRFTQADSSTSRSYGGTGLGLAISKKILELQGVKLQLESEPGRGSCFYFTQTFPVSDEPRPEPGIASASCQEGGMIADLDNPSPVHDDDPVGMHDRVQPVRDDEQGASPGEPRKGILNDGLGFGVCGSRRLVEHQDRRIEQDRPRDTDALLLSTGKPYLLADDRIVTARQRRDPVMDAGGERRGLDLLPAR